MSLLLRQACQETLDKFGLSMYHTEINNQGRYSPKHLNIVSECGKILVTITGITFTKNEPTRAEIEYAVELFNDFMVMHGKLMHNYVTRAKALQQLKDLKSDFGDFSVSEEKDYNWKNGQKEWYIKHYDVTIKDGPFAFQYEVSPDMKKTKFKDVNIRSGVAICHRRPLALQAWNEKELNKKVKKIKLYVQAFYDRAREQKAVNELLEKVTACNV